MKLHIFGCEPSRSERQLRFLGGGYDAKTGRVVLIVQDDDGFPGTLTLDVTEARDLGARVLNDLPPVTKVVGQKGPEAVTTSAPTT